MNTYAEKTQENKRQAVSHGESKVQRSSESTFQFIDNRPEAVAQRKLQEMANNSPQAKQAAQFQVMADNHSAQQHNPIQKKKNNTGLPDNLKTGIENLSGYSMDNVKVHYNSDKPAQLHAHAYAEGTDIHLASGQEKHLPHEAWHVVQQKQGKVKPTFQMKGKVNINDDAGLEKEADVMGSKALNAGHSARQTHIAQFKGGILFDTYRSNNRSALIQKKDIVQRIIVIPHTQLDFGMIVNVYQMLKNGIDHRVTLLSLLQHSDVSGEQIGLQGHGYGHTGAYSNMSAQLLAETLRAAGVDDSNAVIDLLSCSSGSGGGHSYAEQLATELGHSSTVVANRGLGVTMDDGYVYSKRNRTPEEQAEYQAIFAASSNEIARAEFIAARAQTALVGATNEDEVKELFLEYGALILATARQLFNDLYRHQRQLLAAHHDADHGLYVSPKH
ncbi:MAG: DUF4157 domain-containing protein [Bacteroidota bacterium]